MKKFVDESWLVLAMGVAFACLLAGTQTVMMPQIEKNEAAELMDAIQLVVPAADPDAKPEELEIESCDVYRCLDENGDLAGWAVVNEGGGFIDKIRLVVGLTPDGGEVIGIKVVKHLETPGLGNKIETKGQENFYPLQYEGKATDKPFKLVKGEPSQPYEIQGITGATYSSQYVMDIVNDVLARIVPKLPR